MRFLVFTQYFPPEIGAPSTRLAAVITALRRRGHEVEVVTAMPNYPNGEISLEYRGRFYMFDNWSGVPVHRVWMYAATGAGFKRLIGYLSFTIFSSFGLFRAERPDFLFVESPPLFLSLPAFIYSRLKRVPYIFNVADLWPDSLVSVGYDIDSPFIRMARYLEKWSYCKAAYVIALTEGIKSTLLKDKNVAESKVLFLPNGVDTEMFQPREPDQTLVREQGFVKKKVILYAGNIGLAQGLDVAIEAMNILQESHADVLLCFIGDGSDKVRLETLVRSNHMKNIVFLRSQPPEFVSRLYNISIAGFVSLKKDKLFEGARPSKMFPIMASQKPVIYSADGEGAEIIRKAEAGLVTPAGDVGMLAEAIARIADDAELREQLGKSGREYVERHLKWDILVGRWLGQLDNATVSFKR